MKLLKCLLLFSVISSFKSLGQSNDFSCWLQGQSNINQLNLLSKTTLVQGNVKMAVILCVEQGQSKVVPINNYLNLLKQKTEDFFQQASNGNFAVEINFLTESEDPINGIANVYELNGMLISNPPFGPNFVMQPALFQDLFQRVDSRYNFGNYDQNNDGVVDFLALIVIRFSPGASNGTTGLPGCDINNYWILTNDDWIVNGQVMGRMRVNGLGSQLPCKSIQQRKFNGDQADLTLSIFTHELGHALFGFTDISAGWTVPTGDDALGDFCNMSKSINFGNRPSTYNPILRLQNGWLIPTPLSSGDKTFSDLLRTGLIYSYVIPAGNNITEPGQAFYFTFHDKSSGSYFEEKWPIPSDNNLNWRGIMIWNHLASVSQSTYFEWYHKPIDIVAAHGKWKWDLSDTVRSNPALNQYVTTRNLYIPDPAKGMDSLEARYSYVKLRWNGTGWLEEGVYQDKRKGSASCFFNPINPQEFTFYSNPNSNWYLNSTVENFSKTVSSNFKMSNLRIENGLTKANFTIGPNANVVSQNTSLVKGNWYFDQSITINSGVTLTIEPGTRLYFNSGASLIVNGTLNAVGNSNNRITFARKGTTGNWGSIIFSGSGASGSTFNYVDMQYGTNIQATSTSNITIQNSTFTNNSNAITFTGSTGTVSNCYISSNSSAGIIVQNGSNVTSNYNTIKSSVTGLAYLAGSYGSIGQNDIAYNSNSGILVGSSCSPLFKNVPYTNSRNNRLTNNGRGINITSTNSLPVMYNAINCTGQNTIFDNSSYDI